MSRDSYLYAVLGGFVAGIFLRSFVNFGAGFALFFVLLGGILFLAERKTVLFAIFLFAAGLGMFRYDLADRNGPRSALDVHIGQSIEIDGFVVDEPDERESVTRLIVAIEQTKILVTTNREPKYAYGDRVSINGKLEKPRNFTDETTLREVDYVSHLAKDGIYYEMFKPHIELIAHGEGNWVVEKLFAFKRAFIGNINRLIPQPHAALLGGLVVGAKQSLGKKLLDDFRTVGVIHIVVLSGYNITIIAYFIEWLFSRLRKDLRLVVAAGAMILFALMVGASATVVRATIMALLVILARSTGRMYAVTRALLVAGFFMLLHNPKILVFDVSFQLSFLATVGLIYFSPLIEPKVKWITEKYRIREIVVATIATQLFVLPFLLYKTGILSLVSLPVNLLILAAIPLTMLFGFLAGIVGFITTIFALPFAWIAYALLAYELAIVEWFVRLPFAAIALASFPLWLVVFWYGAYGFVIWKLRPQNSAQPLPN
ncbi:MAG: ComEC/Rec2 family competence protein [bacterium]|nr:ComEC/Rec2 family competence protein [bacterium]